MNLFDKLEFETIQGEKILWKELDGKIILVVNVASYCGFTYQYHGLEKLYQKYKNDGLVILAFPCNQFGKQEPGTEEEINHFCATNFSITFPILKKVNVNGYSAHPFFQKLKKQKWGWLGPRINWNFTKFLIDKKGKVRHRFSPRFQPEQFEKIIHQLIQE